MVESWSSWSIPLNPRKKIEKTSCFDGFQGTWNNFWVPGIQGIQGTWDGFVPANSPHSPRVARAPKGRNPRSMKQPIPENMLLSMDWFKGKSEPETIDFPIKKKGLSGSNFPD